jgi:hypothetical protein
VIGTGQLASTDLSPYDVLIVPSDQHQAYLDLAAHAAQIDAWVTHGGRLEYHAAGYGFNGGDPTLYTLPGGMTVTPDFPSTNVVLLPDHPIAAGVPSPFTGNAASHVRFLNIPASAQLILGNDTGLPNCVQYAHGAGLIVASGQTLEWGYAHNQAAGQVLRNLVPYVFSGAASWLSAAPDEGVVPPGQTALVTVTFDATDLEGGIYHARVRVESNDPVASAIDARPARGHRRARHALRGRQHQVVSSATFTSPGSSTHHVLLLPSRPEPKGASTSSPRATSTTSGDRDLIVEGQTIGHVGEHGYECGADSGAFNLSDAQLAQFGGDRSVDLTLANTPTVEVYCYLNRHTVRFSYRDRSDRLELGMRFVGTCHSETLEVANTGTDTLRLAPPVPTHAWYTASLGSLVLAPHATTPLIVTFCPLAAQDAEARSRWPRTIRTRRRGACWRSGAILPDIA